MKNNDILWRLPIISKREDELFVQLDELILITKRIGMHTASEWIDKNKQSIPASALFSPKTADDELTTIKIEIE